MGKGSSGSTTSTTTNPVQAAQMPFLQEGWQQAQNLYQQTPPYATIPDWGKPERMQGNAQLTYAGQNIYDNLAPTATGAWQNAVTGGMGLANSPATPYYQSYAQGTSGPQQQMGQLYNNAQQAGYGTAAPMQQYANQLAANNNLGMSQLGDTASGAYLNGNPWFGQMVQNALDPITRNFQTATAPQLDASFAGAGRYGSGAMLGQRENAQNLLADQLAKTSSNLYGQNYANERAQQLAAAGQYGQLYNQGLTGAGSLYGAAGTQMAQGIQQAADLARQQLGAQQYGAQGLQAGYNTGNQAIQNATQMFPQLAAAQYVGPQGQIQGGEGLASIQQPYLSDSFDRLDRYLKQIGAIQGGSSSTTQPYFTNPLANAMAGITGGLNIAQKLGGMGLGGSSLGGLGGATFADSVLAAGGPPLALGVTPASAAAAGVSGLPAIAAAPAAAGWIVCTELMRQGRMPRKYWAAGARVFDGYPAIGKRGYYVWAIPLVYHLRAKPQSLLSRFTATVFNWRAEDLAAQRGVRGARKLLRGRLVTAALALPCLALGAIAPTQDWRSVYVK